LHPKQIPNNTNNNNTIATTRQQTNGNMSTKCTPLGKDTRPTHLTLATLHRELNFYALEQKTHLGGGRHGYLALLLTPAAYLAISNAAFIEPVHPGPNPAHQPGATAAQITETNRAYAAALVQYTAYHNVEQQLKTMLLDAVPSTFTQLLEDQQFGYALVSTFTILNHLDANYGTVTTQDLANNLDSMDKHWDPSTPIEDLWTQIAKARNYAAIGNNAISDTTALISATKNLQNTGLFTQAFEHWRAKTMIDQTYPNFMTHFNLANVNRLLTTTTAEAGYTATTNQPINKATVPNNNKENERNNGSVIGYHYCWTHGVNKTHKGLQCTYPKEGHIKEATIGNMQGGCVFIYQPANKRKSRNPATPAVIA
jgi:hypothetical protein